MIEESAVRAVFERSMGIRPDESCLIITDTVKEPLARPFLEYGRRIVRECRMEVMEPLKINGEEPPKEVADLMSGYDVQLLITEKSLTHTKARIKASDQGSRIASMPGITEDIINRSLDVDYREMGMISKRLEEVLKHGKRVRVTTGLGTGIDIDIGLGLHPDTGILDKPGMVGNLPAGEVSFAPEGVNGVFVSDASIPGLGKLGSPITFRVLGGKVHDIEGERSGDLEGILDKVGPRAYRIAELGIGTNPKARITGVTLEDEKVLGTCHIALGNNLSYGGTNDVPLHMDCVIKDPTILVDGREIMKKGKPKF